jgi:hypothetical protein
VTPHPPPALWVWGAPDRLVAGEATARVIDTSTSFL